MALLQAHCQNIWLLMHRGAFASLHRETHNPHTLVLKGELEVLWINTHWVPVGEHFRRNNLGPVLRVKKKPFWWLKPVWCLLRE